MKKPKASSPYGAQYLPRVDFDDYKDRYQSEIQKSISFIGQSHDFFTRVKVRRLLALIESYSRKKTGLKVLDVGCGVGITDRYLKADFKKLHGVDIGRGIIRKAAKLNPEVEYRVYNGKKLPYPAESMDVVFAICVLHHIPAGNLELFLSEMKRVTKKGGLVVIFEHNPYNPLTLRAVNHCDLDEDAILLPLARTKSLMAQSGLRLLESPYILFTPFGGAFFRALDGVLGWLPLGAQYFVLGKK